MGFGQSQCKIRVEGLLPIIPAVFIVVLLLVAFMGERGLLRSVELDRHRSLLQSEVDQLLQANEDLRGRVTLLQQNSSEVERVARETLGMVKEGEIVYQFQGI